MRAVIISYNGLFFLTCNISKVWVCRSRRSLFKQLRPAVEETRDSEETETCAERDSALWRQDWSSLGRKQIKCHFTLVRASVCKEQQVVRAQKRHLKPHIINFARDAARVGSASRLWARNEPATEITFTWQFDTEVLATFYSHWLVTKKTDSVRWLKRGDSRTTRMCGVSVGF